MLLQLLLLLLLTPNKILKKTENRVATSKPSLLLRLLSWTLRLVMPSYNMH